MPRSRVDKAAFVAAFGRHGSDYAAMAAELGMTVRAVRWRVGYYRKEGIIDAPPLYRFGGETKVNVGLTLSESTARRLDLERGQKTRSAYVDELLTAFFAGQGQQSGPQPKGHALRVIVRQAKEQGKVWTEAELSRRNLPFYLSRTWLVGQLERGETYSSLARAYGYNFRTLANFAKREHGLEQHRTRADIYDLITWPATVTQIADKMGGDNQRAAKWASEAVADGRLVRVRRGLYTLPDVLD